MATYFISRITVHDREAYEAYKAAAQRTIAQAGGRYLVRGGETEAVEGERDPRRLVILEFPDRAAAEAWWNGAYATQARPLRLNGVAEMDGEIVDGV
ncbi:MAG: DUF1330 domain-containing protein [Pseudomonadota bacterium]